MLCSPGFRLNTTVLMTKGVSQWINCIIECVKEPCCRSINYKKTFQNEPNCEMLHDVVYNTTEKVLERNFSYDYVYLLDPQKVWIDCRGTVLTSKWIIMTNHDVSWMLSIFFFHTYLVSTEQITELSGGWAHRLLFLWYAAVLYAGVKNKIKQV